MKKLLLIIAVLLLMNIIQGCQLDIQGPSMTAKAFYKTENQGDVYKSRGSGMSGGNSYASNGGTQMTSTGSGGSVVSWGSNRKGK
jgi:hypothetical protein